MADFMQGMDAFQEIDTPFFSDETEEGAVAETTTESQTSESGEIDKKDDLAVADQVEDLKKEVDENIDDKIGEPSDENTSNSQYSALITALGGSLPYLNSDEVNINNADEFVEYVNNKLEEEIGAREFSDLTDNQRKYLEGLRAGLPDEDIRQNLSYDDQLNSIKGDDIEADEELRKNLIYQAYKQSGLSDAKAKSITEKIINSGEDIEEAKDSLNQLKEGVNERLEIRKADALKQRDDAKKAYEAQMKKLKDTIDSPSEIIGEKTLSTRYKTDLYNLITKPQKHDGKDVNFLNKYLIENPVEANIVLGHLYLATDGFKADKIKGLNPKTVKSKAVKDLANVIERGNWGFGSDNNTNDLSLFENKGFDDFKDLGRLFK